METAFSRWGMTTVLGQGVEKLVTRVKGFLRVTLPRVARGAVLHYEPNGEN